MANVAKHLPKHGWSYASQSARGKKNGPKAE
jgi:hypothetical protein